MKVAITGASGLIGAALAAALQADDHEVVRLVRRAPRGLDEISWDPAARRLDPRALADVDAVVHLAGAPVGPNRWTKQHKAGILASRVDGTSTVSAALAAAARDAPRRRVLLSASGSNYYGDTGTTEVDESAPPGTQYLSEVCVAWEGATTPAE